MTIEEFRNLCHSERSNEEMLFREARTMLGLYHGGISQVNDLVNAGLIPYHRDHRGLKVVYRWDVLDFMLEYDKRLISRVKRMK